MTSSSAPDPILLTLFANRFMSVAEAMGKSLRQVSITSLSAMNPSILTYTRM
jgi:5-oxoprolinase (ATP-hydrolysing)